MKIPLSWLKDFIDLDGLSVEDVARKLTLAGMEVDEILYVGLPMPVYKEGEKHEFKTNGIGWDKEKLVVAEIREVKAHPNADKLTLLDLYDGQQDQVVLTGMSAGGYGAAYNFVQVQRAFAAVAPKMIDVTMLLIIFFVLTVQFAKQNAAGSSTASSSVSGSPVSRTIGPSNSPAACSSAPRSPVRSPTTRRSCCSTSRSARSTTRRAR